MGDERRKGKWAKSLRIVTHRPLPSVRVKFADVTPNTCDLSDGENRARTVSLVGSQRSRSERPRIAKVSLMTDRLKPAGFDAPIADYCNLRSP